MKLLSRRKILGWLSLALPIPSARGQSTAKTTQPSPTGFFTIASHNNHWWIVDPGGQSLFSIGLNHIDPTALIQAKNSSLWRQRYGTDIHRWLAESVRKNLIDWGFNTVGLTAGVEAFSGDQRHYRRSLSHAEHRSLNLPYGFMLPVDATDPITGQSPPIDFRSNEFAIWCDRVAKTHCDPMRGEKNLIGYWYRDRPIWKAPRSSSKQELVAQADAYYRTLRNAIRRYDPHHLLLGDRYDATRSLSASVVRAAVPHVDVLSVDCSGDAVQVHHQLAKMAQIFDRPILVSDHAIDRLPHDDQWPPAQNRFHDPRGYTRTLQMLTSIPQVLGYHLCGGYLRGDLNRRGLLDENERPDTMAIDGIRRANQTVARWAATASVESP